MYLDQAIGVSRQLVDLSPFSSSPFIPRITRHTEMRSLCSVVVLLALLSLCSAQFKINCGYQYPNGSYVSLESLKGTYYLSNVVPSNSTPPTYAQPGYNISLEVSICQAAQTRQSSLCTNPLSAVNVLANNTCLSAGEASVAGWNLNPSNNGASLIYYHGVNITHVNDWSTRIYFECAPTASTLTYQFYSTPISQFHLIIYTPAVCAINAVTPPSPPNNTPNCTASFRGETIDLSPLKSANGSYFYPNINNTGISFEVQICGNVVSNFPSACTTPSPANVYNITSGVCTPVGDINAYAFSINPSSGAGVSLILYHGAPIGLAGTLQTRLYFECLVIYKPGPETPPLSPNQLVYEHYSGRSGNGGSYHLIMETNYSCPASILATTTAASSSSSLTSISSTGTTSTSTAATSTQTSTASTSSSTSPSTSSPISGTAAAGTSGTTSSSPASSLVPTFLLSLFAALLSFLFFL